jgi:crotonobetainyl-CoA:carnitine CoA-transferase CaiB-like acyl-CoA transferase
MRNRNKRSIALNLKEEKDREIFLDLIESADGLVENLRAGVLDRLGVGWEVCHERNSRLVYAAIRGFGDPMTGESPYKDWPAYDLVAQAMGGGVATTGENEENILKVGPPVGDLYSGLLAGMGMLAAILHARETGEGQFIDVGMMDAMMSMSEVSQMLYTFTGQPFKPRGNSQDGSSPYDIYKTADSHCVIAMPTNRHWKLLCELIGRPELGDDDRTRSNGRRVHNRALVDEAVGGWAKTRTNDQIIAVLGGKIAVGPVYDPTDWETDPHAASRNMLVPVAIGEEDSVTVLNCPIKFSATPSGIFRGVSKLNEDGEEIRKELGIKNGLSKN